MRNISAILLQTDSSAPVKVCTDTYGSGVTKKGCRTDSSLIHTNWTKTELRRPHHNLIWLYFIKTPMQTGVTKQHQCYQLDCYSP